MKNLKMIKNIYLLLIVCSILVGAVLLIWPQMGVSVMCKVMVAISQSRLESSGSLDTSCFSSLANRLALNPGGRASCRAGKHQGVRKGHRKEARYI